jgi:hypothetical protein
MNTIKQLVIALIISPWIAVPIQVLFTADPLGHGFINSVFSPYSWFTVAFAAIGYLFLGVPIYLIVRYFKIANP